MKSSFFDSNILARIKLQGSGIQLGVLRILLGAHLFYAFNSKIFELIAVSGPARSHSSYIKFIHQWLLAADAYPTLILVGKVAAVLFALGVFTRVSNFLLLTMVVLVYNSFFINFGYPIHWLYSIVPLFILFFSDCGKFLSVDSLFNKTKLEPMSVSYRWPIELITLWFFYIYFAAGYAKLFPLERLPEWLQGGTIQNIFYTRELDSPIFYLTGKALFNYAQPKYIFSFLSVSGILLELSAIVLLLTRRLHFVYFLSIIGFHGFLFMLGVAGFMQPALVLGIALINPQFFSRFSSYLKGPNNIGA